MPNTLSQELLAQLFSQESTDPFLTLVTLSHPDWDEDFRLVNNTEDVVSRGLTYLSFPVTLVLPVDDGETSPEISIEFDNVSLYLIGKLRSITSGVQAKLEMILHSLPDDVQITLDDLVLHSINYNKTKISAKLVLENLLNTKLTSEKYTPKNFPGVF